LLTDRELDDALGLMAVADQHLVGGQGNLRLPLAATPEPGRMIAFLPFQRFVWEVSDESVKDAGGVAAGSRETRLGRYDPLPG